MRKCLVAITLVFSCINTSFALSGLGTQASPRLIQSLADFDELAANSIVHKRSLPCTDNCNQASGQDTSSANLYRGKSLPDAKEIVGCYKNATLWNNKVSMHLAVEMNIESQLRNSANRIYDLIYRRDKNRTEWFGKSELLLYQDKSVTDSKYSYQIVNVMNNELWLFAQKNYDAPDFFGGITREFKQIQKAMLKNSDNGGFLDGIIENIGEAENVADKLYENDNLSVTGEETVNGIKTFIVEATTCHGRITAWITPEKGHNALKYSIVKNGDDIILVRDQTMKQAGLKYYTVTVDLIELQKIDGVFVPVSGRYIRNFQRIDGGEETVTYNVKRSGIDLNPDFDALGAFKFHLPDGTILSDLDHPGTELQLVGETLVPYVEKMTILTERAPIYDPQANAEEVVRKALVLAKKENKHVVLMYGFNACDWCYKLHDCFHDNPDIQKILDENYVLVMIDVRSNKDFPKHYGAKSEGYPYLTVLDADGKVLVNQTPSLWVRNRTYCLEKISDFLMKWKPDDN